MSAAPDVPAAPVSIVVVDPSSTDEAIVLLAEGARGCLFATGLQPRFTAAPALRAVPPPVRLSTREIQILQGMADGLTAQRVAGELGLSPLTIKSHMARITRRLEARNRVHAVLLALRLGLIT